jgi:hypothetical protein
MSIAIESETRFLRAGIPMKAAVLLRNLILLPIGMFTVAFTFVFGRWNFD